MRRRLPVYLLIDTSGSMRGEPIAAVNNGLDTMIGALKQDPQALENVHLTLITFDIEAKVVHDMTPLDSLLVQPLDTPQSGPTHMGEALEEVLKRVPEDVRKGSETEKGDYQPLLFIMTDGKTKPFAVGELIEDAGKSYTVESVARDHVIVKTAGVSHELYLPETP